MAKNRVIYQTEALYAGPSPATGAQYDATNERFKVKQINRVQSVNYGYTVARRDVNQYAELAAIDRIVVESPTVNLDFTYLNSSFLNESFLGFYVNSGQGQLSCITNILNKTEDERNYYIKTSPEGVDSVGDTNTGVTTAAEFVIGIGNGFISNFTAEASVGDFPRTTIQVEALNCGFGKNMGTLQTVLSDVTWANISGFTCYNPALYAVDGANIGSTTSVNLAAGMYAYLPPANSNHFRVIG